MNEPNFILRKLKLVRIFLLSIILISIGFTFERSVVKSEVKSNQSMSNRPYEVSDYGYVPIYSDKSIGRYNRNNARERFLQKLEDTEFQTLVGTYYTTKNNLNATLMLNNKGATITVYPTAYSLAGTALSLEPIVVDTASYRELDLRELLADAGRNLSKVA